MNKSLEFLISQAKIETTTSYDQLIDVSKLNGINLRELKEVLNKLISYNVPYSGKTLEKYNLHDLLPLTIEQYLFCTDSLSNELSEVIWLKDAYSIDEKYWQLVEDNISKILNSYPVLFSSIVNIGVNYYIKIDPERTILHDFVISSLKDFSSFQREYLFKTKELIGSNLCNIYRIKIKNDRKFIIVFELNHIISDGWSMDILRSKLLNKNLSPIKRHTNFLNIIASRQITEGNLKFINNKHKNSKNLIAEYSEHIIHGSRFDIIHKFCTEMRISTFTLFYSLLILSEHKMSLKKTISLGSAVNGRDISDFENEIYCFIKFIKLNCNIENQTLIEFLRVNQYEIQKKILSKEMVSKDEISKYYLILILHNFSKYSNTDIKNAKVDLLKSNQSTDYVTYNIWQDENSNTFTIKLDYPKFQFDRVYISSLTNCFLKLINSFEINLKTKINDLCIN